MPRHSFALLSLLSFHRTKRQRAAARPNKNRLILNQHLNLLEERRLLAGFSFDDQAGTLLVYSTQDNEALTIQADSSSGNYTISSSASFTGTSDANFSVSGSSLTVNSSFPATLITLSDNSGAQVNTTVSFGSSGAYLYNADITVNLTNGSTGIISVDNPVSLATNKSLILSSPTNVVNVNSPIVLTGTGSLSITGTDLTEAGAGNISVAGTTTLNAVTNITFENSTNSFSGPLSISATDNASIVSILNNNPTILSDISSHDLRVNATSGGISQVSGSCITMSGGFANFISSGSVTLTQPNNDFDSFYCNVGSLTLFDKDGIVLTNLTSTGDMIVNSTVTMNVGDNGYGLLNVTGSGSIRLRSPQDIIINVNLSTVAGNISITANGDGLGNYPLLGNGVSIDAANITTNGGNIEIVGRGSNQSPTHFGFSMTNGANVSAGGSGTVQITGYAGAVSACNTNRGINIDGSGTIIGTNSGNLTLTGYGFGTGSTTGANGISITGGAIVRSLSGGNLILTGRSGGGSGANNHGVYIAYGSRVSAGGAGSVTVNGTTLSTNAASHGIVLNGTGSSTVASAGGDINLIGTNGTNAASMGLKLDGSAGTPNISSSGGAITVIADRIDIGSNTSVNATTSGCVTISPKTTNRVINLGGADDSSNLGLSIAELGNISAGCLTIGNSTSGNLIVTSAVNRTGNLTLNTGNQIRPGADINATQALTFANAVTLTANTVATGGSVNYNSTINGNFTLRVTSAGAKTFAGQIGNTAPVLSLTANGGGTINLGANATSNGAIAFADPLTLTANSVANGTSINFGSTINGAYALQVLSAGTKTFSGQIGNTAPLASLTVNNGGPITLGANVTTIGAQTYHNPVTLTANTVASGSAVSFNNTVNGAYALQVTSAGAKTFAGQVGGSTPLTSLTADGGGTVSLGANVTTSGQQSFDDAVSLTANSVANGSSVSFNNTINGAYALQVLGTGTKTFGGQVGNSAPLACLTVSGGGSISLGANVSTSGQQDYQNPVTLTANSVISGSAVSFSSTINGAYALQVTSSGAKSFSGQVGNSSPLTSLTANGGGSVNLGSNVTTSGSQTWADPITLTGNAVASGSAVSFNSSINGGYALQVTSPGVKTFSGLVGNSSPLISLRADGGGSTSLTGNVTTTGQQVFTDAVTLTGTTNLATTNSPISFGSTLNGTYDLSLLAGTGNISFGGAVGGSQALNNLTINSANLVTVPTTFQATNLNLSGGTLNANSSLATNLNVSGGTANLQSAGVVTGNASVSSGSLLSANLVSGTLTVSGGTANLAATSNISGAVTVSGGTLVNAGLLSGTLGLSSGTANMASTSNVSGAVTVSGGTLVNAGLLSGALGVSNGTANLASTSNVTGATTVSGGLLVNAGRISSTISVSGGTANMAGTSNVTGAATVTGGTLINAGRLSSTLDVSNGTANVVQGGTVVGLATLSANGSLYANAAFNGGLTATGGTLYTYGNGTTTTALNLGSGSLWNASGPSIAGFGLISASSVTIGASANLSLTAPPISIFQSLPLINNTGSSPISGSFYGLPQGSILNASGLPLSVSYTAGTGSNDMVLTMSPTLMRIVSGNNQTASANGVFTSNLTVQLLGGSGNSTPVPGAHVLFQLPVGVTNMKNAGGYFNNDPANLTANIVTDSNGNATIQLWGNANSGPFNIQPVLAEDRSFTSTFNLGVVGLAVQKESINRSNVRYLDLVLADPTSIPDITALNSNIVLQQVRSASVAGGANITPVNLTLDATNASRSTVGWTFDFGTAGIGSGGADAITADGVYQMSNKSGSTVTIPGYQFHRLLGDANGDKVVDAADTSLVGSLTSSLAWRYNSALVSPNQGDFFYLASSSWAGDTNGDGRVNATDINITGRWRGRKVIY